MHWDSTKATLHLEDGSTFVGSIYGATKSVVGEIVCQTGMVNYVESLTDPSYAKQLLTLTYPLIGNYGVPSTEILDKFGLPAEFESDRVWPAALIVEKLYVDGENSHWQAVQSLSEWLRKADVPCLSGIDVRQLVKKIRETGSMKAKLIIESDNSQNFDFVDVNAENLVDFVSRKEPVSYGSGDQTILAVDCGLKNNQIRCLAKRGFKVKVVPWNHPIDTERDYDGLFLSNGPGDPEVCEQLVDRLAKVIARGDKPIFGICLGHQIILRAIEAETYKLKYGNRGHNQPCIHYATGRCYITSQNHGYAVGTTNLPAGWKPLFTNENDKTNEGIVHASKPFFSVQFHPEHTAGPTDCEFLFDVFADSVRQAKNGVFMNVDQELTRLMTFSPVYHAKEQRTVLMLGSGDLTIGQAGEFDYSGAQALKALREEGIRTVLINPNIATVQTPKEFANSTHFLPITKEHVTDVIKKERPTGILCGFGGQTALNCAIDLYKNGIFKQYNVHVLGTQITSIIRTEDRQLFIDELSYKEEEFAPSEEAVTIDEATEAAKTFGYPVQICSSGGVVAVAKTQEELERFARDFIIATKKIVVESYYDGWREWKVELTRDAFGKCTVESSHQNQEMPTEKLSKAEWEALKTFSKKMARYFQVIGRCAIRYTIRKYNLFRIRSMDCKVMRLVQTKVNSSSFLSAKLGYKKNSADVQTYSASSVFSKWSVFKSIPTTTRTSSETQTSTTFMEHFFKKNANGMEIASNFNESPLNKDKIGEWENIRKCFYSIFSEGLIYDDIWERMECIVEYAELQNVLHNLMFLIKSFWIHIPKEFSSENIELAALISYDVLIKHIDSQNRVFKIQNPVQTYIGILRELEKIISNRGKCSVQSLIEMFQYGSQSSSEVLKVNEVKSERRGMKYIHPHGFDYTIIYETTEKQLEVLNTFLRIFPESSGDVDLSSVALIAILNITDSLELILVASKCLEKIARNSHGRFDVFGAKAIDAVIKQFEKNDPRVCEALSLCADALADNSNFGDMKAVISKALGNPNPSIRTQTDLFLQRTFMKLNTQTIPKKMLKTLLPLLIKHSEDSDSKVRDASYAAMGAMMRAIGKKLMLLIVPEQTSIYTIDKMKDQYYTAAKETRNEQLKKRIITTDNWVAPPTTAALPKNVAPPKQQVSEEETVEQEVKEPLKLPTGEKKKEEKKKAPTKEIAENEPQVAPKSELLLNDNGDKAQRIKEEKQLKLVKWNFQAPTDEHITQLQTLLGNQAKVSLMSQLFHKDFKQHLAALDTLVRLVDTSPRSLLANSDLLFKWCTLRFFETNPAAQIKVLELCKVLVELIRDTETPMSQEELTSFVPYLLLKTGEPEENMRTAVRDIINVLSDIVGPLKMAPMLLDALKSKNARQRSECLLVIESYIASTGISPLKALTVEKIVAPFVGDKDVNVRNAAINVLVACFRFEGDQMWKAAGRMADKDRSLVEERIKRSGAKAGSGVATSPPNGGPKIVVPQQQGSVVRRPASRSRTREPEPEDDYHETVQNNTFSTGMKSGSRYALRDDVVSTTFNRLAENTNVVTPPQPPSVWPGNSFQMKRTNSSSPISSIDTSDQIQRSINNISSSLADVAQDAMYQVTYVLNQPEQRHLVDRKADLVFRASAAQLDMIIEDFSAGKDVTGTMEACSQMLFILMGGVEAEHGLEPLSASPETVKAIISSVLRCIIQIGSTDAGYAMARSLNRLAMRLVYRVELSNLLCGLILATIESIQQDNGITELVSKLSSKWCDELEKRRAQLRASDIVDVFNKFYVCALAEKNMDINDLTVQVMDNYLERVILQQGDVVLDAARRLSTPHIHLTRMINKILQTMKERNIAPIMPGTLETRAPEEDDSVVVRTGVQVCVNNILRDLKNTSSYTEQLNKLVQSSDKCRNEYSVLINTHTMGEAIEELVSEQTIYGAPIFNNPNVVNSMTVSWKVNDLLGKKVEETPTTPPNASRMDTTFVGTPLSRGEGSNTITRTRGNMIRPKQRPTMSREQHDELRSRLQQAKFGK